MKTLLTLRPFCAFVLALMLAIPLAACGDSSAHYSTVNQNPRVNQGGGDNQVSTSDYRLDIVGESQLEAFLGETVSLSVRLTKADGEPVADQGITYQIIESPEDPDMRLESQVIFVDDDGVASNRLRVGNTLGAITVEAAHPWVHQPVRFNVDVTAIPVGDLQVSVVHDTDHLHALTELEVFIWRSTFVQCQSIPFYGMPVDEPLDDRLLGTLSDVALFNDLASSHTYTVSVIGRGSHGQISARGCLQDIEITADDVSHATVDLSLLPLSPNGAYDVISYWDFSEALAQSGSVGSTIMTILEWVTNPGGQIASFVIDTYIGPFFCDDWGQPWYNWTDFSDECVAWRAYVASYNPYQTLQNFINDQISSIGVFAEIQQIGQDLMDTVSNMKVESILTVDNKAFGEGELEGRDSWRAMYFYWTRGCDGTDPECGEIRIGLGDGAQFGALEARWDGRLYDYDKLEIDPHDMTIPYGQVITYILNNHIIPAVTGGNANNLGQAFEYFLCSNLGSFSIAGFTFDASTVQGFCTTAFSTLGLAAEIFVNSLTYSIDLFISGGGTMVDLTSNSVVDLIEEGFFLGELIGEDGSTTEMEALFSAERRQ